MFVRRRFAIFTTLIGVLCVYLVLDSRLVTGEDAYEQLGRGFDEINEAFSYADSGAAIRVGLEFDAGY